MTPQDCQIQVFPNFVEYRSASCSGVRVVRVFTTGETRILAQTEQFTPSIEVLPMSLTLREIEQFVRDTLVRQTNTNCFGLREGD